jgi:hypothetical protein
VVPVLSPALWVPEWQQEEPEAVSVVLLLQEPLAVEVFAVVAVWLRLAY